MNYKETLFFIGKCLTINHEHHNKLIIEKQLKDTTVDWDAVVKVSTGQFVFPALYCNLKKAEFLHYLPEDLVGYMEHITGLNRERNEQIVAQAHEINTLLLKNNITPIFTKGTGNLIEGLYDDIAERMVGDIDFIVDLKDYNRCYNIMLNEGKYANFDKNDYNFPQFKHKPRITNKDSVAAVEIHKELLNEKFSHEFNYNLVNNDKLFINNFYVLSYKNQLSLSIIAKQINDNGVHFKNMALRNAYDVFLLSYKTKAKDAFSELKELKPHLNSFLASCYYLFGEIKSLDYHKTATTKKYLKEFNFQLSDTYLNSNKHKNIETKLNIINRFNVIYKSIFNSSYRNWLLKRVFDKKWQSNKLIQLGLKKSKLDV